MTTIAAALANKRKSSFCFMQPASKLPGQEPGQWLLSGHHHPRRRANLELPERFKDDTTSFL
jgi:hypothetical protein